MHELLAKAIPFFVLIFVGYLCGRLKFLGPEGEKVLSKYVFNIAMPAYLFVKLATMEVGHVLYGPYLASYAVTFGLICLSTWLWVRWRAARKGKAVTATEATLNVMSASYANSAFLGIPFFTLFFGEPSGAIAIVSLQLTVFASSFLFVLDHQKQQHDFTWRTIPRILLANPIILSILLGLTVSGLALPLPVFVDNTAQMLGLAALPTALLTVGITLSSFRLRGDEHLVGEVGGTVVIKTLLNPLLAWLVGHYIFNLSPQWLTKLLTITAMPTAITCYVFAQNYGTFIHRASQIVFASTLVSIGILMGLLFVMGVR